MHHDKEYVGIMRLHKDVEEKKFREIIKEFIGKRTQLPPVRSAVKRQERIREVKSFDILEIDGKDILFKTKVEAGTYIRKICSDG
jgi:H/ACA ribonucleoprotein complex subunit 4